MHLYRCINQLFQASERSATEFIRATATDIASYIQIGHTHQKEILPAKCQ